MTSNGRNFQGKFLERISQKVFRNYKQDGKAGNQTHPHHLISLE